MKKLAYTRWWPCLNLRLTTFKKPENSQSQIIIDLILKDLQQTFCFYLNLLISIRKNDIFTIIVELKVGTSTRDHLLHVVAREQSTRWLTWARVIELKVYPGIPMPQQWRWVQERSVVEIFVIFVVFCWNACQALLTGLFGSWLINWWVTRI